MLPFIKTEHANLVATSILVSSDLSTPALEAAP
jgi:hypothetical protein